LGDINGDGKLDVAVPCEYAGNVAVLQNNSINSIIFTSNLFSQDTIAACGSSYILSAGAGFNNYNWNTGDTTQTITVNSSGWYHCTVTNNAGCSSTDSVYVSLLNAQIQQNDTTVCSGNSISLSLATSGLSSNSCAPLSSNLQNGLMGHWPFCGNANDECGNGNNGTVYGATLASGVNGIMNSAYQFVAANNSYISLSQPFLGGGQASAFTMHARVKANSLQNDPNIWGKTFFWGEVNLLLNSGGAVTLFWANSISGNKYSVISSNPGVVQAGQWYDIVIVFGNSSATIFINGNAVPTNLSWSAQGGGLLSTTQIEAYCNFAQDAGSSRFGVRNTGGGWGNYFDGEIDEFNIWSRMLLSSEIATLITGTGSNISWSTGDTTASINVIPSQTTTYYCTVSNGISSCTDSVTVTVDSVLANFFAQDTIAACGISTALSAPANYTYSWSTGDTTQNINVTSSGWFACTLSNAAGCSSTDSVYVSLLNAQIQQNDTTICAGTSLSLSLASSGASSNSCTPLPANLQNGLVGYWPFCGNANDESGNGNHGTVNGATLTIDRFGNMNAAYSFNGLSDYIQGYLSGIGNTEFTSLSAWIYYTGDAGGQPYDLYFQFGSYGQHTFAYGYNYTNHNLDLYSQCFANPYSAVNLNNNWHHLTVVDSSTVTSIYIDGQIFTTFASGSSGNCFLGSNYFLIGGGADNQFVTGKLDDIGIWNRALTAQEVQQLYIQGNVPAISYLWSTGDTTASINVTPSQTTTYYCTVSNGISSCTDSVTVTVSQPTIVASATSTIVCAGTSSTLSATGAASYTWMPGNLTGSPVVTPTSTTIYTVTGTNASGCTNTSTIEVAVNPLPTINTSTSSSNICTGASTTLSATGAATYTWMPGNLTGSPVVTPTSTTTYTVTGTNASGCTNTSTVMITMNPLPTIVASASPATICAGASSTLNATGGTTYSWLPGGLSGSPLVSPTNTTTYTVTGTNANGCTNTATKTITVNPLPTIVANASAASICAGSSSTLSATGGTTYVWMPGNLTGSPIVTPTATTTYTVTGTNASGCSNTATKTITVNPLPNVVASASSTSICAGASTTLSATGAATYTWMPGSLTGSPTVTPTTTTTYTVTGTNASGCTNTATIMISVNATLPVVASASSTSLCMGASSTLSATGAATYTWMPGNLTGSPVVSPISTTTYTVTGTSASGCSNTSTVTIVVNPLPTVVASASSTSICSGASSTLSATGGTAYTWMPGNLSGSPIVTPTATTTYTVTGTNASGCSNTATKTITVNPLPNVVANASSLNICAGASTTLSATGAATYTWMPGNLTGSPIVTPTSTTTYTVTGTNASGCSNTSTVTIVVNPLPTITASTSVASICVGASSALSATGASSYTWMPGNLTGSPMVTPTTTTTYTVTGTNTSGCSNTATVTIVVYPIVLATITPAGPTTFCQGDSVVLQGNTGAGLSYQWYNGTTLIAGASNANYTASSNGNYVLQVSSSTCSVYSSNQSVVVHANPVVTLNAVGATTFCQGGSVLLQANAGAGFNYQWYNGTSPITGANAANYTTGVSGTYAVLVSDANACTAWSPALPVVANPLPIAAISASGPTTFCSGNNVILSTPANTGYAYQWSNGLTIAGATNSSYTVTQGGNYQVLVSDATGCTASNGPITIVVNPSPVASIVAPGPTSFCQGGSVMLNANTGTGLSYQWYNGATSLGVTSSIYTATQSGSYQVVVSNAIGCSSTSTPTVVTVFPTPTPVITGAGNLLSVTGGPFTTYQWYLNGVAITGATNATYVFTQNGNYTVKVGKDGCVGESVVYIVKNVGVDDLESQLVVISPNPASGMVQIEGYKPHEIRLFNSQGQLVLQRHEARQFSVSHLASGIYYVQLYNKEGALLYRQKLIRE
jgi:hypothetical protein